MRISDWSSDVCSSDLTVLFSDIYLSNVNKGKNMSYEFKKSRHIRASASASVICFSLFVAATPAPAFAQAAQAENYQDEGIVVTARKREELLIDVLIGRASCRERGCQYV